MRNVCLANASDLQLQHRFTVKLDMVYITSDISGSHNFLCVNWKHSCKTSQIVFIVIPCMYSSSIWIPQVLVIKMRNEKQYVVSVCSMLFFPNSNTKRAKSTLVDVIISRCKNINITSLSPSNFGWIMYKLFCN